MNGAQTVFKVYRNDAESRVEKILALTPSRPELETRMPLRSKISLKTTLSIWRRPHVMG